METSRAAARVPGAAGLETFLGGMETHLNIQIFYLLFYTLKPSLVEWKLFIYNYINTYGTTLKPSLVEWKLIKDLNGAVPTPYLETFLGGMETPGRPGAEPAIYPLETFLGGMETGRAGEHLRPSCLALKPSLVEWKPTAAFVGMLAHFLLETFLGGMETGDSGAESSPWGGP